jgi:hypothetical protein
MHGAKIKIVSLVQNHLIFTIGWNVEVVCIKMYGTGNFKITGV